MTKSAELVSLVRPFEEDLTKDFALVENAPRKITVYALMPRARRLAELYRRMAFLVQCERRDAWKDSLGAGNGKIKFFSDWITLHASCNRMSRENAFLLLRAGRIMADHLKRCRARYADLPGSPARSSNFRWPGVNVLCLAEKLARCAFRHDAPAEEWGKECDGYIIRNETGELSLKALNALYFEIGRTSWI